MGCFGKYLTHAQICDNVRVHNATQHMPKFKLWQRVQSATEWAASVHTSHMPKGGKTFVVKVLQKVLLQYIITYTASVHNVHVPKAVITFVFIMLRNTLGGFGTYFTHAQSCDNLRVQSAAEWTASVQNQTTRKREHFLPVSSFRVSVFLCFSHLRASLIASAIIDCSVFLLSAKTAFLLCAFSRFRVFAVFAFSPFSRFRFFPFSCLAFPPFSPFSGFRVFAFSCSAGGIPAAGTQISCAQCVGLSEN